MRGYLCCRELGQWTVSPAGAARSSTKGGVLFGSEAGARAFVRRMNQPGRADARADARYARAARLSMGGAAGMGGPLYASMDAWAKSLSSGQLDDLLGLFSFGEKLALRAIQKEADPHRRAARAAEFVSDLSPSKRARARAILTDEQRQGFQELTGATL